MICRLCPVLTTGLFCSVHGLAWALSAEADRYFLYYDEPCKWDAALVDFLKRYQDEERNAKTKPEVEDMIYGLPPVPKSLKTLDRAYLFRPFDNVIAHDRRLECLRMIEARDVVWVDASGKQVYVPHDADRAVLAVLKDPNTFASIDAYLFDGKWVVGTLSMNTESPN